MLSQLGKIPQKLKNFFFKNISFISTQYYLFLLVIKLFSLTTIEKANFVNFWKPLTKFFINIHLYLSCNIWIDIDFLKKVSSRVMNFYIREAISMLEKKELVRFQIAPIIFTSDLFDIVKKNHLLTKLKFTSFVQVIIKTSYLIQLLQKKLIVQMDYLVIINIMQQSIIISTPLIIKMNLWFIIIFQFFNSFYFKIFYQP